MNLILPEICTIWRSFCRKCLIRHLRMRNTKGVLPVTGIVPPITNNMHRSFTDSIIPFTRIILLVGENCFLMKFRSF